jgi:transposase
MESVKHSETLSLSYAAVRTQEKRYDSPLVTLALVLDGSGFPRMSRVFAGNASEPATLQEMINGLNATPGATVVLGVLTAT